MGRPLPTGKGRAAMEEEMLDFMSGVGRILFSRSEREAFLEDLLDCPDFSE